MDTTRSPQQSARRADRQRATHRLRKGQEAKRGEKAKCQSGRVRGEEQRRKPGSHQEGDRAGSLEQIISTSRVGAADLKPILIIVVISTYCYVVSSLVLSVFNGH